MPHLVFFFSLLTAKTAFLFVLDLIEYLNYLKFSHYHFVKNLQI